VFIDGHEVTMPAALLTEIMPPEPALGSWVAINRDGEWLVFRHASADSPMPWYCHDKSSWMAWPQVYAFGDPVPIGTASEFKGAAAMCPVCKRERGLRVDGHFKHHGPYRARCSGSGTKPAARVTS